MKIRARNPGPAWGYPFLVLADRVLPEFIFRPARAVGTAVAVVCMPSQRRNSREYLRAALGRKPSWADVFRHFFSFEEALMLRLRLANGLTVPCDLEPGSEDFQAWLRSGGPLLLGTMHVGVSDMLGFQLSGLSANPVYLVRESVANSRDTEALAALFGPSLRFIWINDFEERLFAIKEALQRDAVVALQCDRADGHLRTEAFDFLGARRRFPVTIYHLALIFRRDVLLVFGLPGRRGRSRLFATPAFRVIDGESRVDALRRARAHFQGFLALLERELRACPYYWYNFCPLNPADEVPAA